MAASEPAKEQDGLEKPTMYLPSTVQYRVSMSASDWLSLGLAAEGSGDREVAEAYYYKAAQTNPKDVRPRLFLIPILLAKQNVQAAARFADEAMRLAPNFAPTQFLAAEVRRAEGRFADAEIHVRRGIKLAPEAAMGHTMMGYCHLYAGRFEDAAASFRRSIAIAPVQGAAYLGLSVSHAFVKSDTSLIHQMESVDNSGKVPPNELAALSFALAKACADLNAFEHAMAHYERANSHELRARFGTTPFDQSAHAARVDATIRLYTKEFLEANALQDQQSTLPVLVVGMMRSGTTLVEQILSSHPRVGAAGEELFWPNNITHVENLAVPSVDRSAVGGLGQRYLKRLQSLAPKAEKVTDKLPGNYLRCGLIYLAVPKAKFVHCCRNPLDTAVSIYTTPNTTSPQWAHRLEDLEFVYRQYHRLSTHWRTALPPESLLEVRYEELVANPKDVVASLLEFCGLEWDDRCLHPERNSKEVATPSLWQVRQPIYGRSVGRWKSYEPWLGPLLSLKEIGESP